MKIAKAELLHFTAHNNLAQSVFNRKAKDIKVQFDLGVKTLDQCTERTKSLLAGIKTRSEQANGLSFSRMLTDDLEFNKNVNQHLNAVAMLVESLIVVIDDIDLTESHCFINTEIDENVGKLLKKVYDQSQKDRIFFSRTLYEAVTETIKNYNKFGELGTEYEKVMGEQNKQNLSEKEAKQKAVLRASQEIICARNSAASRLVLSGFERINILGEYFGMRDACACESTHAKSFSHLKGVVA